jgi:hypothetical protein
VAARTELINATRGLVKSMGARLPKSSIPSFAQKVEEAVPVEIREALLPLVRMAAALSDCIQGCDEEGTIFGFRCPCRDDCSSGRRARRRGSLVGNHSESRRVDSQTGEEVGPAEQLQACYEAGPTG